MTNTISLSFAGNATPEFQRTESTEMPSLNLDLNYFDHPKTRRLVSLLGRGAAELPLRIWTHCGKLHPETGQLLKYPDDYIEEIAGWWGEPGKMIETLLRPEINLLERIDGGYQIHDWFEHAGHLVAFKKRAKTAAKKRWKRYASSMQQAYLKDATTGTASKEGKVDSDFLLFYAEYPKKRGRKQAYEQ